MVLMEPHHTEQNISSPQDLNDPAATVSHASSSKKSPERACIVTRQSQDKNSLLRFVRAADGTLYFDLNHKLPGRGLYVSASREHLQTAIQKNIFTKAAKAPVTIPDDLMTQIETILRRSALDQINLARRSSDIIMSSDKIKKYIKNSRLGCYITVSSKDSDAYKTIVPKLKTAPVITLFSAEELNKALKMDKVAHIAFKDTPLCEKFLDRYQTLMNVI